MAGVEMTVAGTTEENHAVLNILTPPPMTGNTNEEIESPKEKINEIEDVENWNYDTCCVHK